jgi:transcriptional regulator with XRE-family HTH domain
MLWSEAKFSATIAENLARLGAERGIENWNQMAVQFEEWARDKKFVEPISVNTLRNIAKRSNAPQASTLCDLAAFLDVPPYMLFIEHLPAKHELVVTLAAVVAAFINGDKHTRSAIKYMLSAITRRPKGISHL